MDRRIPASARRPHRRPAAHRPAAPHPVLELQQLAGNRAVAARLAGGPHSVQRRLPGPEVTTSPAITELTPAGQVARAQQLQDMIRGQLAQLPPDTSLNITNAFYDHGLIISKPVTEYASTAEALTALRNMLTIIRAEAPAATRPGDRPNSRPSGPEKLALQGMIIQAKAIFNAVAGGHADQQITTVFNPANAGDAARVRGTFAAAAAALQRLYDSDVIFLDTRGDLQTKGVGALTGTGSMTLPAGFARATTPDGVQVLLHESFHAVDSGIIDKVYQFDPSFSTVPFETKMINADHFAEVARTFVSGPVPPTAPRYINGPASTRPHWPKVRDALRLSTERLTRAWVQALWTHEKLETLRRIQGQWLGNDPGDQLEMRKLHRASEIFGMTLHERFRGWNAKFPAVTEFDFAVVEQHIPDLHAAIGWIGRQHTVDIVQTDPGTPPVNAMLTVAQVLGEDSGGLSSRLIEQAVRARPAPSREPAALLLVIKALNIRENL